MGFIRSFHREGKMLERISTKKILLISFFISLILNIIYFLKSNVINDDGLLYIACAQALSEGNFSEALTYTPMPFVPFLITLVHFVVPNWFLAGQIISFVCISVIIFPFYAFTKNFVEEKHVKIACLFFATFPMLHFIVPLVIRDAPFILFLLLFLWSFFSKCHVEEGKRWKFEVMSFFFSLFAAMCRTEGVLLFGLNMLILFYKGIRNNSKKIKYITSFILLVIISVGIGYKHKANTRINDLHKIVRSPKAMYQSFRIHELRKKMAELEVTLPGGRYGGNLISIARNYFYILYFISIFHTLMKACFPSMFILGLMGLYLILRYNRKKEHVSLFFWFVFFALIPYGYLFLENFISKRYLIGCCIILYAFTGYGFSFVIESIEKKVKLPQFVPILIIIILMSVSCLRVITKRRDKGDDIIAAAKWLKKNTNNKCIITTNDPRILFHAGFKYIDRSPKSRICKDSLKNICARAKKIKSSLIAFRSKAKEIKGYKVIAKFVGKKRTTIIIQCKN